MEQRVVGSGDCLAQQDWSRPSLATLMLGKFFRRFDQLLRVDWDGLRQPREALFIGEGQFVVVVQKLRMFRLKDDEPR